MQPHLIFDGEPCEFTARLGALGVTVLYHRVSFYDALIEYGRDRPGYAQIAAGAFLRTELPLVETDDDIVLYTDCDVLFIKEPAFDLVPEYFACAPEFTRDDYVHFNTGVMLMNLPALRRGLGDFVEFIRANLARCETFDQSAYRLHYGEQMARLAPELNWKPYWGMSDAARIVHFHGPKPSGARRLLADAADPVMAPLRPLFEMSPSGYEGYLRLWDREAADAGVET